MGPRRPSSIPGRLGDRAIMAVDTQTVPVFTAGKPRLLCEGPYESTEGARNFDVTPDGQRFLLMEAVEQPMQPVTRIDVVLNWIEELKHRVPAH